MKIRNRIEEEAIMKNKQLSHIPLYLKKLAMKRKRLFFTICMEMYQNGALTTTALTM